MRWRFAISEGRWRSDFRHALSLDTAKNVFKSLVRSLHAINCACGIVVYLEPLQSRFWSETFHVESNLDSVAGSRASSNLLGIAEEGHIDLDRTGQRSGHGRSARRTYVRHSLSPGGGHARGPKRSCLVLNQHYCLATLVNWHYIPLVSASLSTSPPTNPISSSLAKAWFTVLPVGFLASSP